MQEGAASSEHPAWPGTFRPPSSLEQVPVGCSDEMPLDVVARMSGCADGRTLVIDDGRLVRLVSPLMLLGALELALSPRRY